MRSAIRGVFRALLLGLLLFGSTSQAALTDAPTSWSNFSFTNYTFGGHPIVDHESSADPSHGPAAVQPASVDIASCSTDGANPGAQSSVLIGYHDADGNTGTVDDAFVTFRMRLDATPLETGQQKGYQSRHWDILIDIDNDGFKEFVLDLRGDYASSQPDRLVLLYNDDNTQEVDATNDVIDEWYASGPGATGDAATNNHTRVVEDTSESCTGDNDYWLDMQVPLAAFDDDGGNQQITPTTPIRIFYSTSTSNTNPLQKDWMNDPGGIADTFTLTDPITFGDTFSGDGGVVPVSPNTTPIADNDSATTPTDTAVSIPVLSNDSDPDGDTLTIDHVGTPSNGSVTFDPDGTIIYTPNSGFSGTDTFTYTVCDPGGLCDDGTVTVMVDNATPNAEGDSATTPTGTAVAIPVLANDSDPNGDTLTIQNVTDASNGTVSISPDGTIIYTPDPGFSGDDRFTYTVCDTSGNCSTATVTVKVDNAAPTGTADSASTPTDTSVSIPVLVNDHDPNGDPLRVNDIGTPANGSATLNPDGTIVYSPDPGFSGTDNFTYEVCDPGGLCDITTVTVVVDDAAPTAVADSAATTSGTSVSIPVLVNDYDPNGDPITIDSVGQPANGTITFTPDGTVIYTPDPGFTGTDVFTYTICDDNGNCSTATANIVVVGPVEPNIVGDSAGTEVGEPVTIPVLDNDTDPNNDSLSIDSVTQPANGSVTVNPDGTITYTPDPGFSGNDTFSYTACDPSGNCNTAAVTVTVNDSAPAAEADQATTPRGAPVTIPVLDNDSDPNGDPLAIENVTQPAHGSISVHPNGTITYTPDPGFSGSDTFSYTVCDGSGNCATTSVIITILQDGVAIRPTKRYKAIVPDPHVRYYVTLENIGSQDQPDNAGPEFEDQLPDGVRYLDKTGAATSGTLDFDPSTRTFSWNGTIPSGESVVIHFTVVVERNGQIADAAIPSIPSGGPWAWLGMGLLIGTVGLARIRRMPHKRGAVAVALVALGIGLSGCSALLPGGSPVDEICNQGRVHVDPTQDGTNDLTVLTDDPSTPTVGDATCFNVISGLID